MGKKKHAARTPLASQPSVPAVAEPKPHALPVGPSTEIAIAGAIAAALLGVFFLVLKMFSIHAYAGDEHIYFYQGHLVAEGLVPYRDFAMAHPPVQSLFVALLLKIGGYSFVFARLLPALFALSGGIVLYMLFTRELGVLAGLFAMGIYLFSFEVLRSSSHFTGVNMTMTFLVIAVALFRAEWIRAAAIVCVLAVFTRLYAAPGVLALVLFALLMDVRKAVRLILYGAGVGLIGVIAVGLWTGFDNAARDLLQYHAQKTPMSPDELSNMRDEVLYHNWHTVLLFAIGLPVMLYRMSTAFTQVRSSAQAAPAVLQKLRVALLQSQMALPFLFTLAAFLFAFILLRMDRVWMYYFVPVLLFAAGSGAVAAASAVDGSIKTALFFFFKKGTRPRNTALVIGVLLTAVFVAGVLYGPQLEHRLGYYQDAMNKPGAEKTRTYQWQDGMLPDAVNTLVRNTLWIDTRVVGEPYGSFTYLLWHESRDFDVAQEMAAEISRQTQSGDTVFGDSGSTPLLALLAGRNIALNEVDTNIQRYRSGVADPEQLVSGLRAHPPAAIILRGAGGRFGVGGLVGVQQLIAQEYRKHQVYRTREGTSFTLFLKKPS